MKIRRIRKVDIPDVTKIIARNYSQKSASNAREEISGTFSRDPYRPRFIVCEKEGRIRGFGGYSQSRINYHIYEIFWLNVDPQYQNRGMGTKMMRELISQIKSKKGEYSAASIILLTSTNPNYFSKRFGFKTLQKSRGEKGHLMSLTLR